MAEEGRYDKDGFYQHDEGYYTFSAERRDKRTIKTVQALIYRARSLLFAMADRGLADPTRTRTARGIAVRLAGPYNELLNLREDLVPAWKDPSELRPEIAATAEAATNAGRLYKD